jgi:predicted DNA-binding protein
MRPQNETIAIRISPEKKAAVKAMLAKSGGMSLATALKLAIQRLIEDGDTEFLYQRKKK